MHLRMTGCVLVVSISSALHAWLQVLGYCTAGISLTKLACCSIHLFHMEIDH